MHRVHCFEACRKVPIDVSVPSSLLGTTASSSSLDRSLYRIAFSNSLWSRVCDALAGPVSMAPLGCPSLLAGAAIAPGSALLVTHGGCSALAAVPATEVATLAAFAATLELEPPLRASNGCQGQRWQRTQEAPSLQPRGFQKYLQGSPQLSGCPDEPREGAFNWTTGPATPSTSVVSRRGRMLLPVPVQPGPVLAAACMAAPWTWRAGLARLWYRVVA
mmetsp:Transcript_56801/g.176135  ORF Transcript_56801/g.176135 Transcript_56801/m.176135 type:complete len:218 (-) Transcript_56801:7-660(-)